MSSRLDQWFARNEQAEELEEDGRFREALELYEANIREGCTISFTYERAALLYRRFEQRPKELSALRRAVELEHKRGPSRRLVKLQERYKLSQDIARRETGSKAAPSRERRTATPSAGPVRRPAEEKGCLKSLLLLISAGLGLGVFLVQAVVL